LELKRIAPLSVGKIAGDLYACIGLLVGFLFAFLGMVGAFAASGSDADMPAGFGVLFGVAGIFLAPIFYGVIGFLFFTIAAAIYNVAAGMIGGVEFELVERKP